MRIENREIEIEKRNPCLTQECGEYKWWGKWGIYRKKKIRRIFFQNSNFSRFTAWTGGLGLNRRLGPRCLPKIVGFWQKTSSFCPVFRLIHYHLSLPPEKEPNRRKLAVFDENRRFLTKTVDLSAHYLYPIHFKSERKNTSHIWKFDTCECEFKVFHELVMKVH